LTETIIKSDTLHRFASSQVTNNFNPLTKDRKSIPVSSPERLIKKHLYFSLTIHYHWLFNGIKFLFSIKSIRILVIYGSAWSVYGQGTSYLELFIVHM